MIVRDLNYVAGFREKLLVAASSASPMRVVLAAALGLMLAMFCVRVWDLGIVHTDDAIWALHAWKGDWDIVRRWAADQGRVWALVSGSIMFAALKVKGTLAGDLAVVACFIVFFLAFHIAVAEYFDRRLAVLVAALNLGLWSLRWEGSVLTAYPAFTWLLGTAFVTSLLAARRYLWKGKLIALAASLLLLLLSLCIHEGVSVLFASLYPLAVLARPAKLSLLNDHARLKRMILVGYAAVVLLYFLAYFGWRLAYPSGYAGNSLAPFDVSRIAQVAGSFALSGSLPFDLFVVYDVNFANPSIGEGSRIAYPFADYLFLVPATPSAIAFGGLVSLVCWLVLRSVSSWRLDARSAVSAIGVGVLATIIPVLPVAMTVQYQQWHDGGIYSYAHTALCHFGVALAIGGALALGLRSIAPLRLQLFLSFAVSVVAGLLAAGGSLMNDAIARDMRSEASRWQVLNRAVQLLEADGGADRITLLAPRFESGSWFGVVPPSYWSEWAKARHGVDLQFTAGLLPAFEEPGRVYLIDYWPTPGREPTIAVARIASDVATRQPVFDRVLLAPSVRDPAATKDFLVFGDVNRGQQFMRIENMRATAVTGVRSVDNVAGYPALLRTQREAPLPKLAVRCPKVILEGRRASFGLAPTGTDCVLTAALVDGWHAPELTGVWSKARVATLRVRVQVAADAEPLVMRLAIKSYSGLGFYPGRTRILIRSGESILVEVEDAQESPAVVDFTVPRRLVGVNGVLDLAIETDRIYNPKALGIAPDTRDLGVNLQSLELMTPRARGEQPTGSQVSGSPAQRGLGVRPATP